MFTDVQSFITEYKNEAIATQRLLDALADDSLRQKATKDGRPLGQIAWHLAQACEILAPAGLTVPHPEKDSPHPAYASTIAQAYKTAADAILETAQARLTDALLAETIEQFGRKMTKGYLLYLFLKHEIHHRGQLTVLMRIAGLPIAGVYGPSKEEWERFGMEAPAY
ncbi:DinB family protein [Paenibacillus sp. N4]|uniref:DinB family protein n=1 Tax=Paenibacillus vietnamensis TaxID=2590547 RepID=UPI001CD0CDFB|nr:DinB family protein [Paenibacillus vietnamensis]MCA0758200.1 DinB family protein [Paenibacillus vietnamensis]